MVKCGMVWEVVKCAVEGGVGQVRVTSKLKVTAKVKSKSWSCARPRLCPRSWSYQKSHPRSRSRSRPSKTRT